MSVKNTTLVLQRRNVHESVDAVYEQMRNELRGTINTLVNSGVYASDNPWLDATQKVLPQAFDRCIDDRDYFAMLYTSVATLLASAAIEHRPESADLWLGDDATRITLPIVAAGVMPDLLRVQGISDELRARFNTQILPLAATKMLDLINDPNLLARLYEARLLHTEALPGPDLEDASICYAQWVILMRLAAQKTVNRSDIKKLLPVISEELDRLSRAFPHQSAGRSEYIIFTNDEVPSPINPALVSQFRADIFAALKELV